jgi:hypothetical protein
LNLYSNDNKIKRKVKRKKFAQYEPGFLHLDVFYLPEIGEKGKKKRYTAS